MLSSIKLLTVLASYGAAFHVPVHYPSELSSGRQTSTSLSLSAVSGPVAEGQHRTAIFSNDAGRPTDEEATLSTLWEVETVTVVPIPRQSTPTILYKRQGSCVKRSAHASSTAKKATSKTTSTASTSTASTSPSPYASSVPDIDVCGAGSPGGNVSCPGAGTNGYYYRCCSGAGHCGPKNPLQDQALYCGVANGCQKGFSHGKCGGSMKPPPYATPTANPAGPSGAAGVAQAGETCGPIPDRRCAAGFCCSGSNYCGTGPDFCGSANWCQKDFGVCDTSS